MSFLSFGFILFCSALMLAYHFLKSEKARQFLLLAGSYIFYITWSLRFAALLAAMSAMVWHIGRVVQRRRDSDTSAKLPLYFGIAACLFILGYFKYHDFLAGTLAVLLHMDSLAVREVLLPLGISFYTLEAISYLCDIYFGKIRAVEDLWQVMLYLGFFPKIVSGPIVKARDFVPQLSESHRITKESLSYGIQLAAVGLFKKVVIADRLGVCVDAVYHAPGAYSGASLLVAAAAYAVQIYCDFSGYSDMAIGMAHILGYDLGRNFNAPYTAENPSDFWRRWHISLSSWFREYVYIPLGGNRKGRCRTCLNLLVTMLLSGLWHGASWNFVLWGGLHGLLSIAYKMVFYNGQKPIGKRMRLACRIMVSVVNIFLIWLLWIPFRADSLGTAALIVRRIFTMSSGITYIYVFAVIYVPLVMVLQFWMSRQKDGLPWKPLDLSRLGNKVVFCAFLILIVMFGYFGDTAFIYAGF